MKYLLTLICLLPATANAISIRSNGVTSVGNLNIVNNSTFTTNGNLCISTAPTSSVCGINVNPSNDVFVQVGGGSQTGQVGAYFFFDSTWTMAGSSVTASTVEVVFSTWTIPAGTLNTNGMCIYFSCNGFGASASLSRKTSIYLDGSLPAGVILSSGSATSSNQHMHATVELCRVQSNSAMYHGDVINGTSSSGQSSNSNPINDVPVNWAAAHTISCAGRAVSGNAGDYIYQYSKGDIH